ncbi:MAG TPA: hypothetical protein VJU86_04445 [Pyrinomonadaceae bacterium]|nr:hypothetical protein [Pyrinomonadaceae bacterium]
MSTKQNPRSHKSRRFTSRVTVMLLAASALLTLAVTSAFMAPPLPGAIFTSDSACIGTNINIYGNKADVYLDGGPAHPNAAGLPDGSYYVQVTEPGGTLLGTSVGSGNPTPVSVVDGDFVVCYQLTNILITASDGSPGFDSTSNPGGEYKVWVSTESTFTNSNTKTDNFKVKESGTEVLETSSLKVRKFYDANANGTNDSEPLLIGWKFRIQDGFDIIRFTPVDLIVAPDTYTVTEFAPSETNWVTTTANPQGVSIADGETKTLTFGNVCLGAGGGLTLGYWSNKNGEKSIQNCQGGGTAGTMTFLSGLNLRNGSGDNFDPTSHANFKSWILSATAANMAYMLSAQLAAMQLNVRCGGVNGTALIYAPGLPTVAPNGFATVNAIMAAANTDLATHTHTESAGADSAFRSYQENLKNALDRANNNLNFVQAQPCPFSFSE